jgi:hypothetical protein
MCAIWFEGGTWIERLLAARQSGRGDSSEAFILSKLVDAGISVLVPWGDNARFDLVAVIRKTFLRIQCKTGRLRGGYMVFSAYGVGRGGQRHRYRPDEIDYYAVRCFENSAVYLVPYSEAGSSALPQFRVEMPKPGSTGGRQTARIRWASKYEADLVIESWLRTDGQFEPQWCPPVVESTGTLHPSRRREPGSTA